MHRKASSMGGIASQQGGGDFKSPKVKQDIWHSSALDFSGGLLPTLASRD